MRTKLSGGARRIKSALARYNSAGQLFCALCKVPVKSEVLWSTHCTKLSHKEKIVKLREARRLKQVISAGTGMPAPPPPAAFEKEEKVTEEVPVAVPDATEKFKSEQAVASVDSKPVQEAKAVSQKPAPPAIVSFLGEVENAPVEKRVVTLLPAYESGEEEEAPAEGDAVNATPLSFFDDEEEGRKALKIYRKPTATLSKEYQHLSKAIESSLEDQAASQAPGDEDEFIKRELNLQAEQSILKKRVGLLRAKFASRGNAKRSRTSDEDAVARYKQERTESILTGDLDDMSALLRSQRKKQKLLADKARQASAATDNSLVDWRSKDYNLS